MNPPIEDSIVRTRPGHWLLGFAYVCELVADVPEDAVASRNADGTTCCIRKSSIDTKDRAASVGLDSSRVHVGGTSVAV